MSDTARITLINIAILVIYTIACHVISGSGDEALGFLIFLAMAIAAHVIILLLLSVGFGLSKKGTQGKAFLLSAFLVLIIGFSACLGVANLH